jgi:hypothetical protein
MKNLKISFPSSLSFILLPAICNFSSNNNNNNLQFCNDEINVFLCRKKGEVEERKKEQKNTKKHFMRNEKVSAAHLK